MTKEWLKFALIYGAMVGMFLFAVTLIESIGQ